MRETTEPLDILRAAGWRMRAPFCFVRRGECLWLAPDNVWCWTIAAGDIMRFCDSLAAVVEWLHPEGAVGFLAIAEDYAPIVEAVR